MIDFIKSIIEGELKVYRIYFEKHLFIRCKRIIKTNPPTVVSSISSSTLAIFPMFSKLVTAGVSISFSFNIISFLTLSSVRNISSSLNFNSKGDILPPRRMRTPFLVVMASSFLNVAPVKIEPISFSLHQFHPLGKSKAISSVISYTSFSTCS